jgi:hypothetical protein
MRKDREIASRPSAAAEVAQRAFAVELHAQEHADLVRVRVRALGLLKGYGQS